MTIIISALLVLLLSQFDKANPYAFEEQSGKRAEDFALKSLKGNLVSITALRGKVVILAFWATWCPSCRDELPAFAQLYSRYKDKGLEVVSVAVENSETRVREFIEKNPVNYPVLMDSGLKVSRQYRVLTLPTTFIIGRDGTISERILGERDWLSPDTVSRIESLLK